MTKTVKWFLLAAGAAVAALVFLKPKAAGKEAGEAVGDVLREAYWGLGMGLTGAAEEERQFQADQEAYMAEAPHRNAARQQKQIELIRADPLHWALEWNKAMQSDNPSLANEIEQDFRMAGLNPRNVLRTAGYVVESGRGWVKP